MVTGDLVTSACWNQDVAENTRYLKGLSGCVQIQDNVRLTGCVLIAASSISGTSLQRSPCAILQITDNDHGEALRFSRSDGQQDSGIGNKANGVLTFYRSGASTVRIGTSGTLIGTAACMSASINVDGVIYGNETANAQQTIGLTLNQGAASDEITTWKASAVAHGMTTVTETDTFGVVAKESGASGGLRVRGLTGATIGLALWGIGTTGCTARSTTTEALSMIVSAKKNGTSADRAGTNENLLAIRDFDLNRFIFDKEGDFHADAAVSASAYDAYNDAALLRSLDVAISDPSTIVDSVFKDWMQYNQADLERARLVTFNDDGHHFVNYTKLVRAQNGAIWQGYVRDRELEQTVQLQAQTIERLERAIWALGGSALLLDDAGEPERLT